MWSRKRGRWRVRCRCEGRRFAVEVTRFCAAGNDGSVSGRGVGRRAVDEAQRGRGAPVGAVRRWSVMGGAGLRGARNERRCAGVVDGAGLAGGEMSEDPLDDLASSLRERHFRGVSMQAMTRSVPPHTPQCSMSMWKTRLRRCIQLMGGGGAWGSRAARWARLGTMWWRCMKFGANTPWYRVRWARGRGTERARCASGTSGAARRAMPNRQDCRFAQPEAAPKGCGTRMCRMNSIGSSTT